VHNGQQKPNLRHKKRGVKWIGMAADSSGWMDGIRTGTSTEIWRERERERERVPDFRSCNTENVGANGRADKRSREQISVL